METFFHIARNMNEPTYIPFKRGNPFPSINSNNNIHKFKITTIICCMDFHKETDSFSSSKFKILNEVLQNIFFSNQFKEEFIHFFSQLQRNYHALSRFSFLYKFKKAKIQVTTDLTMTPIPVTNKNVIIIMQNNVKYMFVLNDLINIIETAISNAPDFFLEILVPKNPYTNCVFSISALYNIYFKCKDSSFVLPKLFHFYFLSNFNIYKYMMENESIIRDVAIHSYIYNSPMNSLYNKIIIMLAENRYSRKLSIHKDFPKNVLVEIMRPFLYYKYISNYGVKNTMKTVTYQRMLFFKLKQFYKKHPSFGRKMYKHSFQNNKLKQYFVFNTEHTPFHLIQISFDDNNNMIDMLEGNENEPQEYQETEDEDQGEDEDQTQNFDDFDDFDSVS